MISRKHNEEEIKKHEIIFNENYLNISILEIARRTVGGGLATDEVGENSLGEDVKKNRFLDVSEGLKWMG